MKNKSMALLAALFASFSGYWKDWIRGSGTQMKRTRIPGKRKPARTKLARMATEHRLDGTNLGGIVSQAFRQDKINRNLARFANQK